MIIYTGAKGTNHQNVVDRRNSIIANSNVHHLIDLTEISLITKSRVTFHPLDQ